MGQMRKIVHQSDRDAWLEARKNYVTASDAVVALGLSKYQTREELVLSKLGQWERPDTRGPEARELGLLLEAGLAAMVRKLWGWPVDEFGWLVECKRQPLLAATPDMVMQTPWGPAVVDMKVTSAMAQEDCKPRRDGAASAARFSSGCPIDYAAQLQAQMACLGPEYKWGAILALHTMSGGEPKMRAYPVRRNESVILEIEDAVAEVMAEVKERAK